MPQIIHRIILLFVVTILLLKIVRLILGTLIHRCPPCSVISTVTLVTFYSHKSHTPLTLQSLIGMLDAVFEAHSCKFIDNHLYFLLGLFLLYWFYIFENYMNMNFIILIGGFLWLFTWLYYEIIKCMKN